MPSSIIILSFFFFLNRVIPPVGRDCFFSLDFSVQTLNILSEYIDDVGMLESISKTCGGLAAALKKVRNAVVDNYS